MALSYAEKLKDPRWQKKRLEVFNRAGWQCQRCANGMKTLHVHHLKYDGRDPWEYPFEMLACLCEDCHSDHHCQHHLDKFFEILARKKTKETKQIRLDRTGLNQDRKMKMLQKYESLYGDLDHTAAFYRKYRENRGRP